MKMKPVNIFCFILLLGLESNIIRSCVGGGSRQYPGTSWQVTISNDQKDSSLVVHCKSKDDDLGEHVIEVGGQYYWTFRENLWETTLFWCNFSSKYGHASGKVFWPEIGSSWLCDRCENNNCIWSASGDQGIYLENPPMKDSELMYRWEN